MNNIGWDNLIQAVSNVVFVIVAIVGSVFLHKRTNAAKEQVKTANDQLDISTSLESLAQKTYMANRFIKAVELMGNEKSIVQIGGILALEKVAIDEPGVYHKQVYNILCFFIKENIPLSKEEVIFSKSVVETALTVIGKRNLNYEVTLTLNSINLSEFELNNSNFDGATCSNVDFTKTTLIGCSFIKAVIFRGKFTNAIVAGANFTNAILLGASFVGAKFFGRSHDMKNLNNESVLFIANFNGANLTQADFTGTDLDRVNFTGAEISQTNFEGVKNLTQEQISSAYYKSGYPPKNLPTYIQEPPQQTKA